MTQTLSKPAFLAPLPHSGMTVTEFYSMHFLGAVFPLTAGLLLYGWRALLLMAIVVISNFAMLLLWRRIGDRGQELRFSQGLWLALLLALMLPAHLATNLASESGGSPWLVAASAGMGLGILLWVLGGLGGGRIHPVLVAYLLIVALFGEMLIPHAVLSRDRLFSGDVLRCQTVDSRETREEPWISRKHPPDYDGERSEPASEVLIAYTTGHEKPPRGWLPLQGMLRDQMPPLEDLVLGGRPGPVGTSSVIAVIVGGLFLLYRGLIDFRIPLIIFIMLYVTLMICPVPTLIAERPQWHWFALRLPEIGCPTAVTFANYEIMAGPAPFMAFFLATAPLIRPMARRARVIYAVFAGVLTAIMQLYVSVSFGPYLALLLASLLTPSLDLWFRPRPLV